MNKRTCRLDYVIGFCLEGQGAEIHSPDLKPNSASDDGKLSLRRISTTKAVHSCPLPTPLRSPQYSARDLHQSFTTTTRSAHSLPLSPFLGRWRFRSLAHHPSTTSSPSPFDSSLHFCRCKGIYARAVVLEGWGKLRQKNSIPCSGETFIRHCYRALLEC